MNETRLATQSLGRDLQAPERALADALEQIYSRQISDFAAVAAALTSMSVVVPSQGGTEWDEAVLLRELKAINRSLDEAYGEHGRGA